MAFCPLGHKTQRGKRALGACLQLPGTPENHGQPGAGSRRGGSFLSRTQTASLHLGRSRNPLYRHQQGAKVMAGACEGQAGPPGRQPGVAFHCLDLASRTGRGEALRGSKSLELMSSSAPAVLCFGEAFVLDRRRKTITDYAVDSLGTKRYPGAEPSRGRSATAAGTRTPPGPSA